MRFNLDRQNKRTTDAANAAASSERDLSSVAVALNDIGHSNHDALLVLQHELRSLHTLSMEYISTLETQLIKLREERDAAVQRADQLQRVAS